MNATSNLKLGLIGDNIAASHAPRLHRMAGDQCGIAVQYDRLVPRELDMDFDRLFAWAQDQGYQGLNITYPYKERAAKKVSISDPLIRAMGAVNTVLFDPIGARGFNTDYTGFMAAYRALRPETGPGDCCLIGTGGVGRAMAFGLVALGASALRLVDKDLSKAETLAADLASIAGDTCLTVLRDPGAASDGADGILNATPVGMVGYEGTPVPADALSGAAWVFDAVYTPVRTEFLQAAEARGLEIISGYELFFHQGVHAWEHFSGRKVDAAQLRRSLAEDVPPA